MSCKDYSIKQEDDYSQNEVELNFLEPMGWKFLQGRFQKLPNTFWYILGT